MDYREDLTHTTTSLSILMSNTAAYKQKDLMSSFETLPVSKTKRKLRMKS